MSIRVEDGGIIAGKQAILHRKPDRARDLRPVGWIVLMLRASPFSEPVLFCLLSSNQALHPFFTVGRKGISIKRKPIAMTEPGKIC